MFFNVWSAGGGKCALCYTSGWGAILDSTFLAFLFSSNWTALANLLTPPRSLLWLVRTVPINKVGGIVPEVQLKC